MLWSLLLGIGGLYVLAGLGLGIAAVRLLCKPRRWSFPEKRRQQEALGFQDAFAWYDSMEWESFTVSREDAILHGRYLRHPDSDRVFVFCHGHTSNIASGVKFAALFWRLGYSVVLYDARFFGMSTGLFCTLGQKETDDLRSVLGWVRNTFGEKTRIGLMGESMGAATVLNVLQWETPMFVAADCPFADARLLLRYMIPMTLHVPPQPALWFCQRIAKERYGFDIAGVRPMEAAAKANVPVFLSHGTGDRLVPYVHSEYMAGHLTHPLSRLYLFAGSDHARSYSDHREDYEQKLTDFVFAAEEVSTEGRQYDSGN